MPYETMIPTRHTENVHAASGTQSSTWPVIIVSAGIGATRPADEIAAPDEAAVCEMLVS